MVGVRSLKKVEMIFFEKYIIQILVDVLKILLILLYVLLEEEDLSLFVVNINSGVLGELESFYKDIQGLNGNMYFIICFFE